MRIRVVIFFSVLFLAFPLLAAAPQAEADQPVGVLHLGGQSIDVYSWSWGMTQTVSEFPGGGGGAGKVQMQDFHFTKTIDKSSTTLFQACANGEHFPNATLTVRKKGQGQQEYLVVKFSDVLVTSYQTGGSSGDALPMESISLNFSRVELQVPGR